VNREWPLHKIEQAFHKLSDDLRKLEVCESPTLLATDGQPLPRRLQRHAIDLETVAAADLVVNFFYTMPSDVPADGANRHRPWITTNVGQ